MKNLFLTKVAGIVTLAAILIMASASAWIFYQPKAPKALTKV